MPMALAAASETPSSEGVGILIRKLQCFGFRSYSLVIQFTVSYDWLNTLSLAL